MTDVMEPGLCRQITLTLLVSTMALSSGMSTVWLTPMSPKLRSFDSPVGRMTKQEISYLAYLPLYIGVFLAIFYGFVAKKLGRKDALVCTGIPSIVSGLLLTFAGSKIALYVGRCFAGCTMIGGVMASSMYISETVNDSMRGTLMAFLAFQINAGVLLSYVLGDALSYKAFNFIGIAIPAVGTILILWLPESPHFLVAHGRIKDAMQSLLWLRDGNHVAAKSELESIKPDLKAGKKQGILEILKSRGARIVLVVGMIAYMLQSLSGIFAIFNYAELIFKDVSNPISPGKSSIIIALLILVSSLISVFLIDITGRKALLYVSFVGSSVSLAVLSSFLYIRLKGADVADFGWIEIISASVFAICYAVGLAIVPGVLTNELAAPNGKPVVCSMIAAVTVVLVIAVLRSFPYLEDSIGLYSVFTISSVVNFLGIFYTWFLVPETAKKSLTWIARELRGERVLSLSAEARV